MKKGVSRGTIGVRRQPKTLRGMTRKGGDSRGERGNVEGEGVGRNVSRIGKGRGEWCRITL